MTPQPPPLPAPLSEQQYRNLIARLDRIEHHQRKLRSRGRFGRILMFPVKAALFLFLLSVGLGIFSLARTIYANRIAILKGIHATQVVSHPRSRHPERRPSLSAVRWGVY